MERKWGLNLTGTCAEDRALVPEVSPVQVSVQRLSRATRRARALWEASTRVFNKEGKNHFFISVIGSKKCCLSLDDNGIIVLRSHQ